MLRILVQMENSNSEQRGPGSFVMAVIRDFVKLSPKSKFLRCTSRFACVVIALSGASALAVVTPQVVVNFDGTLNGTTYTLGAGEIDTTGTFQASGAPTLTNGFARNQADGNGFFIDPSSINGGNLNSINWVAEISFNPDVPNQGGQLQQATLVDVQGDFDLRYQNASSNIEVNFWDGAAANVVTSPEPAVNTFSHLAVSWDASVNVATLYVDGVIEGSTTTGGNTFSVADASNVSWGFFGRDGFDNRSVFGFYSAVAFSTFTGSFDPQTDFQIAVPETDPTMQIEIDRDTGNISIVNNTGSTQTGILGYSIIDNDGGLDRSQWKSIADNYDVDGPNTVDSGTLIGSVDVDDSWLELSSPSSQTDLSEAQLEVNPNPNDGGVLANGDSIDLGNSWRKSPLEDLTASILFDDGTEQTVPVTFVGGEIPFGDLDGSGSVDALDWDAYIAQALTDTSSLLAVDAYLAGDFNNDGINNIVDTDLFIEAFESQPGNGAGSFAAMLASRNVPEPSSLALLLLFGAAAAPLRDRLQKRKAALSGNHVLQSFVVLLVLGCGMSMTVYAGDVTNQILVNFDGSLSDATYTLGPGEIDTTGTFAAGDAAGGITVSGGTADLPGTSGFFANSTSLGDLTTQNWIAEVRFESDLEPASRPLSHFLDVQGDTFFRFNIGATQFGFWDGATEPSQQVADFPAGQLTHAALTWNSNTNTMEGFVNGVSQGTLTTGNAFAVPSPNLGFGFFARTGFFNRPIDGQLDAVAFSTFTGAFDPENDFQVGLEMPVVLELEVNTISGATWITNNTGEVIDINSYEIASAGINGVGALNPNPGGWNSFDSQDLDSLGAGSGESWDEAGNVSDNALLEGFLLGSTSVADSGPMSRRSIGNAFDNSVFGSGVDGDLVFTYRTVGGDLVVGNVVYDDTPPTAIDGDFNEDGVVNLADYTVWRDNLGSTVSLPNDNNLGTPVSAAHYNVWKQNFGQSASAGSLASGEAVPEPTSVALLLGACCGLFVSFRNGDRKASKLFRSSHSLIEASEAVRSCVKVAAICCVAWACVGSIAQAMVTSDREYLLGEGVSLGTGIGDVSENGAAGAIVGANVSATGGSVPAGIDVIDSAGLPATSGSYVALEQIGNPVYVNVNSGTFARPGTSPGDTGVQFNGAQSQYLSGLRLGLPESSVSSSANGGDPPGPIDYSGISNRGFQFWARPGSAGSGTTQSLVADTLQHGVRINAANNWVMQYAGAEFEASQSVQFDTWSHIMVVRPFGPAGGSRMYVNGEVVAFGGGGFDGDDDTPLILGANSGESPGNADFYTGVLDNLDMFVMGISANTATNYGAFDLATDNEFIADVLSGMTQGDLTGDGNVDSADVDVFVDNWLTAYNPIEGSAFIGGDLNSRELGDFNLDGFVTLSDAFILHEALGNAGAGGLNFALLSGDSANVPEPGGLVLAGIAASALLSIRGRIAARV